MDDLDHIEFEIASHRHEIDEHALQPDTPPEEGKNRLIGTCWIPKENGHGLHWKVTDYFTSVFGRTAVQIEKYQGGRNSPAIITTKRLKKFFNKITEP